MIYLSEWITMTPKQKGSTGGWGVGGGGGEGRDI